MGVYLYWAVEVPWRPQLQVRAAVAVAVAAAAAVAPAPAPAPALVLVLAPDRLSCSEPEVGESHALKQRIFLAATVGRRHGG